MQRTLVVSSPCRRRVCVVEPRFDLSINLRVYLGNCICKRIVDEIVQVFIPGVLGSLDPIRRNERPGLPCRSATHEVAGRALNPKVADVVRGIRR